MAASVAPSIRPRIAAGRLVDGFVSVALAVAMALSFLTPSIPPDTSLDGSWQEMLIRVHGSGIHFGREFIWTWGPWGFLCTAYHLGSVHAAAKLAWMTLGQLVLAGCLVGLTHRLPLWRRLVFGALLIGFSALFLDTGLVVVIALVCVAGLMRPSASPWSLAAGMLLLGFLAQLKFMYLVLATAAVAAAAVDWACRAGFRNAAVLVFSFAAAVVGWWMGAGQSLGDLYPYFRRSLEIVAGYRDAMGLDETWPAFFWGVAVALSCAGALAYAWRRTADRLRAWIACGFLALTYYVMWEEGYIRADGHIYGFFTFVLILSPVAGPILFPGSRFPAFEITGVVALAAISALAGGFVRAAPVGSWTRIRDHARLVARLGDLPGQWQREYEAACDRALLPRIRAAVGSARVDVYNFGTGIAMLNGLNLAPRPVFQGYFAFTPGLEGCNLRFYQSDRAPQYLLWDGEQIDNRYPGQDDAYVIAGMPGHYRPLFSEGDYWLLQRLSPLVPGLPPHRPLVQQTLHLFEEVSVPPPAGHALWLELDAHPTALGRVRALLYKPAELDLTVTDSSSGRRTWRLVPRVAKGGFLLAPTLSRGQDMASLLQGRAALWIRSFHLEAPPGQEEFWSRAEMTLSELSQVPVSVMSPVDRLVEDGIFDRPATSIRGAFPPEVYDTPECKVVQIHADGEVQFRVGHDARRFSMGFGIREGAYSGGGHTRGVVFSIKAQWVSGQSRLLWSERLDPSAHPRDGGLHQVEVSLPEPIPDWLTVHLAPAAPEDIRWCWSYLAGVRFDAP